MQLGYPTAYGTLSHTALQHRAWCEGDACRIESSGPSTLRMNVVVPGCGEQAYNLVGTVGSVAEFDAAQGALTFRSWYLNSDPANDALDYHAVHTLDLQQGYSWRAYVQSGLIVALPLDGPRPELGPSAVNAFLTDGPLATAEALMFGAAVSDVGAPW